MKKFFSLILTIFICLFCCSGCTSTKQEEKLQVKIFCNYRVYYNQNCSGTIPYTREYGSISDLINSIDNIVDVKMESITEKESSERGHIHYLVLYRE
jgi:hypothetical protein